MRIRVHEARVKQLRQVALQPHPHQSLHLVRIRLRA
jgi:hypothetical protein